MSEIKAVILENNENGDTRTVEADFIHVSEKNLYTLGRFDRDQNKCVYQYFNTYKFSVIDIKYKEENENN